MVGAFSQMAQPVKPTVLKPLVYCEFRSKESPGEYGDAQDVTLCAIFACERLEEMAFCQTHATVIRTALEQEATQ